VSNNKDLQPLKSFFMKTRFLVITLVFVLISVKGLLAQDNLEAHLKLYPTIPSTSAIGQHGSFPTPNAYGQVPISIPLANASIDGVNVPVTISYNTMGVKVNQNAGEIGLGWSMGINNFYIEQTIKGGIDTSDTYDVDDDYNDFFEKLAGEHFNPPSLLADPIELLKDLDNAFLGSYGGNEFNALGRDEFSYSFNGYSGKFLFDEDGSIINLSSSGNDLKIERVLNGPTLNDDEFIITDEKGNKYYFEDRITYTSISESDGGDTSHQVSSYKWYLKKIVAPNNEEIQFIYANDTDNDPNTNPNLDTQRDYSERGIKHHYINQYDYQLIPSEGTTVTESTTTGKLQLIKTIIFEQGKLEFNYSTTSYNNMNMSLASLEVFNKENNTYKKQKSITFDKSYFSRYSSGSNTLGYSPVSSSLKLRKIYFKDASNSTINKYEFTYDGQQLPGKFSKAQDYWGYYNGQTSNTDFIPNFSFSNNSTTFYLGFANREPNPTYAKAGILTRIDYPTKGHSIFEYELNYYVGGGSLVKGGGLRVKTIKSYDGVSSSPSKVERYEYGGSEIGGITAGHFMGQEFVNPIAHANSANLSGKEHIKANFFKEKKFFIERGKFGLPGDDIFESTSIQSSSSPQYPIDFKGNSVFYDKITKYVTDNANINNTGKTEYYYDFPLLNTGNYSGSTYYTYENPGVAEPIVLPANPINLGDITKYSLLDDANLRSVIDYKYTGGQNPYKLLRFVNYNYTPVILKSLNTFFVTLSGHTRNEDKLLSEDHSIIDERHIYMNYRFYTYYHDYKVDKLMSITETSYPDPESGLEMTSTTTNDYVSNTSFRVKETIVEDSKGEKIITKIHYPDQIMHNQIALGFDNLTTSELNGIDALKKIKSVNGEPGLHRIGEVVQTETYLDKDGDDVADPEELLAVHRTNYKEKTVNWDVNGDGIVNSSDKIVLPKDIQTLKGEYDASDNILEDRIVYDQYDDNGNPLEVKKADGTSIVYIWGYNKEYPVAKIENATYSQISSQVANLQSKSDADNDRTIGNNGNEGALRTALNTLRNSISDAMVTTYTYDPLIGVTSVTDPKGYTTYYEYDNFNRLKRLKDADGNILSENDYHYKGQ
jgi:YD repeat-containing protein